MILLTYLKNLYRFYISACRPSATSPITVPGSVLLFILFFPAVLIATLTFIALTPAELILIDPPILAYCVLMHTRNWRDIFTYIFD